MKRHSYGRDKVRKVLAEAVKAGYATSEKERGPRGRILGQHWRLCADPKRLQNADFNRHLKNQGMDDQRLTDQALADQALVDQALVQPPLHNKIVHSKGSTESRETTFRRKAPRVSQKLRQR